LAGRRGRCDKGVRSNDISVLEEQHRRTVSHLASLHFCTSKSAVTNLAKEGITENVHWTGDLTHDFFLDHVETARKTTPLPDWENYILVTIHKATNFRSPDILRNLVTTLENYHRPVVFVTHPKTKKALIDLDLYNKSSIRFMDSMPYTQMVAVLEGCAYLVTDSGGLQREASYLRKHCLVRRETVGWSSLIDAGINRLIGTSEADISAGLAWAEANLLNEDAFRHFDEFYKPNAGQDALQTLVESTCLTHKR
jgi:UDP-GlcNAc3NAcA epimerase